MESRSLPNLASFPVAWRRGGWGEEGLGSRSLINLASFPGVEEGGGRGEEGLGSRSLPNWENQRIEESVAAI